MKTRKQRYKPEQNNQRQIREDRSNQQAIHGRSQQPEIDHGNSRHHRSNKIETEIISLLYPSLGRTRGRPENDNTPRQQNIGRQPAWRREQIVTNRKKSREDQNTPQQQYTEQSTSKQISTTTRSKQHRPTQRTSRDTGRTTTTQRQRSKADYINKIKFEADQNQQEGSSPGQLAPNQKGTKTDRNDQEKRSSQENRQPRTRMQIKKKKTKMQTETTTQQIMAYQGRPR